MYTAGCLKKETPMDRSARVQSRVDEFFVYSKVKQTICKQTSPIKKRAVLLNTEGSKGVKNNCIIFSSVNIAHKKQCDLLVVQCTIIQKPLLV